MNALDAGLIPSAGYGIVRSLVFPFSLSLSYCKALLNKVVGLGLGFALIVSLPKILRILILWCTDISLSSLPCRCEPRFGRKNLLAACALALRFATPGLVSPNSLLGQYVI